MPVTHLHIKWPDDTPEKIYSPSSIIGDYFEPGEQLPVSDFDQRISEALQAAARRVQQVYGFECTAARSELRKIKQEVEKYRRQSDTNQIEIIRVE